MLKLTRILQLGPNKNLQTKSSNYGSHNIQIIFQLVSDTAVVLMTRLILCKLQSILTLKTHNFSTYLSTILEHMSLMRSGAHVN